MNFVSGRVVVRDGAPRFEGCGIGVALPGASVSAAATQRPAVTLGVRPEHVGIAARAEDAIPATIELVEPMGADSLVWLCAGTTSLSARVGGQARAALGDQVGVSIAAEHVSLFDDATGERL